MAKTQNRNNESTEACPSTDNSNTSSNSPHLNVRQMNNNYLIIYLNIRENLTGHLKLKDSYWVPFSMVMF